MKDNSSVFSQLKPQIRWTKIAHRSGIFGFLSGLAKIQKTLHVIFETTSHFCLIFASLLSVMRDNSSVLL